VQFENTIAENVEAVVCVEAKMSGTQSSISYVTADMLLWHWMGVEDVESLSNSLGW
jgi:hypothetical protein